MKGKRKKRAVCVVHVSMLYTGSLKMTASMLYTGSRKMTAWCEETEFWTMQDSFLREGMRHSAPKNIFTKQLGRIHVLGLTTDLSVWFCCH